MCDSRSTPASSRAGTLQEGKFQRETCASHMVQSTIVRFMSLLHTAGTVVFFCHQLCSPSVDTARELLSSREKRVYIRRRCHARTVASERPTILAKLARTADEPAKVMLQAGTWVRVRSSPAADGAVGLQDITVPSSSRDAFVVRFLHAPVRVVFGHQWGTVRCKSQECCGFDRKLRATRASRFDSCVRMHFAGMNISSLT